MAHFCNEILSEQAITNLCYNTSMNIKFTTVTWYSQLLAIILALVIFTLGFYLGTLFVTQ